jgi:outer membrane protein
MKLKITTIRWAVLAVLAVQACAAQAIDLVGAYDRALGNDPIKLAADEAVLAGREKFLQGDALLRPRVELQIGLSHVEDRMTGDVPPALEAILPTHSSGLARQATVQLTQPIYDANALAGKQQLYQHARLAEIQFDQVQQGLAQRVAEVYFGVLAAQESLRVTLAEKVAITMQRDRAQARFDVGRGKVTDLHEALARYDQILTKEINARSTLELRRAQFEATVGTPADALAELAPNLEARPPEPDNLLAWQLKGEEQGIAVRMKQSQLEVAIAEIGKHRMSGRPSLSLVASYSTKDQSGGLSPLVAANGDNMGVIGVQFNMPLYAGGALDSQEREALARQREAEQQLSAVKRDVRLQVQDAYLAVRTGVSRITSSEQSLVSARKALEATTLGRDLGTRTELDVLEAQQRAFTGEFDLVQARLDYLLGRIHLASAAGDLSPQNLREINTLYLAP